MFYPILLAFLAMLVTVSQSDAALLIKQSSTRSQPNDGKCSEYSFGITFQAPESGSVVVAMFNDQKEIIFESFRITAGAQGCIGDDCPPQCGSGRESDYVMDHLAPEPSARLGGGEEDEILPAGGAYSEFFDGLVPGAEYTVTFIGLDFPPEGETECIGFSSCLTFEVYERVCP